MWSSIFVTLPANSGPSARHWSTAATNILNDDVDAAENGLATGTSTFHNVCGNQGYPDMRVKR